MADLKRCTFKDLCIDVGDPAAMAPFWASALGLQAEALDNGSYVLGDGIDEHTVWLNAVPEPRTVKQRVHLDVMVSDVAELRRIGADLVAERPRWTVLADPEGGELCAVVRRPDELRTYRLSEVVVDAVDPAGISAWWGDRLGTVPRSSEDGTVWWLEQGTGRLPMDLVFQRVPEPKTVKNRIHWDVLGDPAGLVAVGARVLRSRGDGIDWTVVADPEGNEVCVFPAG